MHEGRPVSLPVSDGVKENHEIFSLTPDRFGVGESSDLLVAEIRDDWLQNRWFYPGIPGESVHWLGLDAVIEFMPVQELDRWVFEADAEKIGVKLSPARFENLWLSWTRRENACAARIDGGTLVEICDLSEFLEIGPDGLSWQNLSELAIDPDCRPVDSASSIWKLLKNREELFELCREDGDVAAFFISCAVEWVNHLSDRNFLEVNPTFGERAYALHQRLSGMPFDSSVLTDPTVKEFFSDLVNLKPEFFSIVCKPLTVAFYVKYFHRLRFGKPSPDEVINVINTVTVLDGKDAGRVIAFLLGIVLGTNRVQALARLIKGKNYSVALQVEELPVTEGASGKIT